MYKYLDIQEENRGRQCWVSKRPREAMKESRVTVEGQKQRWTWASTAAESENRLYRKCEFWFEDKHRWHQRSVQWGILISLGVMYDSEGPTAISDSLLFLFLMSVCNNLGDIFADHLNKSCCFFSSLLIHQLHEAFSPVYTKCFLLVLQGRNSDGAPFLTWSRGSVQSFPKCLWVCCLLLQSVPLPEFPASELIAPTTALKR